MTSELVRYTPPSELEWRQLVDTADMVAATDFAPKTIRGNKPAVMACLLTGRELGIGPMQALRDIYVVNGRPSLSATLMVSRVRAAGHRFRTLESTATSATVQLHRRGEREPEPPVTFTLEDARRAKLASKDIWQQYPDRMCWARAASAACRRDAPECLGGVVYTPEEIESIPADGEPSTTVDVGRPEMSEVPGERAASMGKADAGRSRETQKAAGTEPATTRGTSDPITPPGGDPASLPPGGDNTGGSANGGPPLPDLAADATAAEQAFHAEGFTVEQASALLCDRYPGMELRYSPSNLRRLRGKAVIGEHVQDAVKLRAERAEAVTAGGSDG